VECTHTIRIRELGLERSKRSFSRNGTRKERRSVICVNLVNLKRKGVEPSVESVGNKGSFGAFCWPAESLYQTSWAVASNHIVRCGTELRRLCRLLYPSKEDRTFGESYSPSGAEHLFESKKEDVRAVPI